MYSKISTDQFINEFQDYPAYDNIRKIASVVDGLKNSSRKVVYYCLKTNFTKPVKTSQLKAKIEEDTQYLHGDITGVVESLAKDYTGTNNINLLEPHGNFGTELVKMASASRYTMTKPSPELYELFDKSDLAIYEKQFFEGEEIEPKYMVPNLPIILINGSEGISSGFAQKILSRNPVKIKNAIKKKLKGNHTYKEPPWIRGFKGIVEEGDGPGKWLIKGVVERINTNTVHIKAIPFTYSLQSYLKELDGLEDKGIIRSYNDNSELEFDFEVKFTKDALSKMKDEDLLKTLKLVKPITENYTVEDENNRIVVCKDVNQILDHFIKVRLEFLEKKIRHTLSVLYDKKQKLDSKVIFINKVINKELPIFKRKKDHIVSDLEDICDIYKVDGTYDYLLSMSLYSLTEEQIIKINNQLKEIEKDITYYEKIDVDKFYLDLL